MKRTFSGVIPILLVAAIVTLAFNIEPCKGVGVIFIEDDGSVNPPGSPISTSDNVTYTFTDNIIDKTIIVNRSHIIIDGNGYTLQGDGTSYGFLVREEDNVTIKETNITNFQQGLWLERSNNTSIIDNNITNVGHMGIYDFSGRTTTVDGNEVICASPSFKAYWGTYSSYITISHNYFEGEIDIWDSSAGDITISHNDIEGDIGVLNSSSNTIVNNTMRRILIRDSGYNTIRNNTVQMIWISHSIHNSIVDNTISGHYFSGIRIHVSVDNTISDNIISENSDSGINMTSSFGNTIIGNTIFRNGDHGIYLDESGPNAVLGNEVSNNRFGILVSGYDGNTLSGNRVENNTEYGVKLEISHDNIVSHNHVANNTVGIPMVWAFRNTFTDNNITGHTINGVIIAYCEDNKFYHNNFTDNTVQVQVDIPWRPNTWNALYPSGGNYWSDYTGNDDYKGPDQNIPGQDGIGDISYVVDSDNIDGYPLKPPCPSHDVGILDITTPKDIVCNGDRCLNYSLQVKLEIMNYGVHDEVLNVTAEVNMTEFGKVEVFLANRSITVVTLSWNTAGSSIGNYTITVLVDPDPVETDIRDNNATFFHYHTILGDVDYNCFVEIKDILAIALVYGSEPEDDDYKVIRDVNGDEIIDIKDLFVAAKNFGLSC